ncbi:6-bladed beta-propeller [Rhodohalobacter halophilus]|uniref:6-bladed beta-propeller n=1 Tax=Rhodohalobacter halophilus TaxID=1812810 RepID=UPI00083F9228|nr:6-bladed beta-propeller [Rhodohalobacter halophilus]
MQLTLKTILLITTTATLISCTSGEHSTDHIRTAELPEIELNHLFTLEEQDGYYFQRIFDIKSDSEKRIFVADQAARHILQYDSEGNFVGAIGREGSGPNEFSLIMRLLVDPQDRLLVFDIGNNRNVLFEEVAGEWSPEQFLTVEGSPAGSEVINENGEVILRRDTGSRMEPGMDWSVHEFLPAHLDSGIRDDNRIEFRQTTSLVADDLSFIRKPFGRTTLVSNGNEGRLYLTWSERFDVEVYNMDLDLVDSVSAEIPNLEVSSEERAEAIENTSERFKSLVRQYIPDTKPVANQMWVDGDQNFWLQTHDSPEYLVLDLSGEPIGSFDLDGERRIMHVDGERVYTMLSDDEGYTLDVYEVRL